MSKTIFTTPNQYMREYNQFMRNLGVGTKETSRTSAQLYKFPHMFEGDAAYVDGRAYSQQSSALSQQMRYEALLRQHEGGRSNDRYDHSSRDGRNQTQDPNVLYDYLNQIGEAYVRGDDQDFRQKVSAYAQLDDTHQFTEAQLLKAAKQAYKADRGDDQGTRHAKREIYETVRDALDGRNVGSRTVSRERAGRAYEVPSRRETHYRDEDTAPAVDTRSLPSAEVNPRDVPLESQRVMVKLQAIIDSYGKDAYTTAVYDFANLQKQGYPAAGLIEVVDHQLPANGSSDPARQAAIDNIRSYITGAVNKVAEGLDRRSDVAPDRAPSNQFAARTDIANDAGVSVPAGPAAPRVSHSDPVTDMSASAVHHYKSLLEHYGYATDKGGANDGLVNNRWDAAGKNALAEWQKDHGFAADGKLTTEQLAQMERSGYEERNKSREAHGEIELASVPNALPRGSRHQG
jgi:hypothetical protein